MTTTDTSPAVSIELVEIPLDQLVPHPDNVRRRIGDVSELAKSIAGSGVLEPLLVLPAGDNDQHMVVAGHRRLSGAKKAKLATVPCVIRDLTEVEVLETMLTENLQRAEITPVEEARAYARLIDLGSSIAEIARKVGRRPELIKSRLAITVLPAKVLNAIDAGDLRLGDAEDATKYADDDDAMDFLVSILGTHGNPVWATGNYIASRDRDREITAITEKLTAKGITIFTPKDQYWRPPYDLNLSKPTTLKLLGLNATQHRAEPCHAVYIGASGWSSKIEQIQMCTAPKRHTTKAKAADRSDLQADPATYATTPAATKAKTRSDKKLRTLAEARHVDAAAERFLRTPRLDTGEDIQAMTLAVITGAITGYNPGLDRTATLALACKLAAADVIPDGPNSATPDWDTTWDLFTSDPTNYPTAIAAATVAICLKQAAGTTWSWDRPGYTALLTWLMHTGYDPADDELELIEATFARHVEEHDELTRYVTEVLDAQPDTPTTPATPSDPASSELDDLTARASELEDGPELDQVNARIAELLDLTARPYFLCVESTGDRYGTETFATFDDALDAQAAAMEAEPGLILAVHTHPTAEAS
jgi:ParB/RepB/Spo0J family partition protein